MYALAGSAAGIGVLALAQPADAEVVYTPAHVKIDQQHRLYHLDLNHDGVTDFSLGLHSSINQSGGALWLSANPAVSKHDEVLGAASSASLLRAGEKIGVGKQVFFEAHYMAGFWTTNGGRSGFLWQWAKDGKGVKNGYLGFKFAIKGTTHYGWARISLAFTLEGKVEVVSGVPTGYAYETIPNKPILAGKTEGPEEDSVDEANPATLNESTLQPASLGLLAMGSPGLSVWRREESELAAPEAK
jgi:hypothetical protein